MNNDVEVYDDFSQVEPYDHKKNIERIKRKLSEIKKSNAEYAVSIGKDLILAKENVPHGKWLETLEELDFTPMSASRLMKIAEMFGDRPELIEGISQKRAYSLAVLPDENLIQLRNDGIVQLTDGTTFTVAEFAEMNIKEFKNQMDNLRNQKNKEISDWRSRAVSAETEMKDMRKQSDEREEFLKQYMRDKDAATADKIERLNKLVSDIEFEKNKLKLELMKNEEKEYSEIEVLEAISTASSAITDVFIKINNVKLDYSNTKMKAKIAGFIHEAQETITFGSIKVNNMIEEELNDDRDNQSA